MIKCYCPNCGTELDVVDLENLDINEGQGIVETEYSYICPNCDNQYTVGLKHYIERSEVKVIEKYS